MPHTQSLTRRLCMCAQIEAFTAAIEADPTNHVLYSNRSGAHAAKADFKAALLDANKCIDLKADWAKGHIPGAVNVPIDWLVQRMEEIPGRDTPLVVACDQGLRAPSAARILKDSGWRKLYTLIDGMEAYKGELESGEVPAAGK